MQESLVQNTFVSSTDRNSYAFLVGQTNIWYQAQPTKSMIQKGSFQKLASPVAQEMSSDDDSASTDEGVHHYDQAQRLQELFQVKEDSAKLFDLDSRVGLNGSQSFQNFSCVYDEQNKRFIVWLGDVTIDKFTKTTFLNLVNFAEKTGAKQMVLVQMRDHVQKEQFQKLFKVLDAHRVSKRGMQEMMGDNKLEEHVEKYALYRIDLD